MGRRGREERGSSGEAVTKVRNETDAAGSWSWRAVLERLHLCLDSDTAPDALAWLDNGTHFYVAQTREDRVAAALGLRVCSLQQVLAAWSFDCHDEERARDCYTVYHHSCFVRGDPQQIDHIVSPLVAPDLSFVRRPHTEKDVTMPRVTYSAALRPLEVRLRLSSTHATTSPSWRVTIAPPTVLLCSTVDAADAWAHGRHESVADFLCDSSRASGGASWGDAGDDAGHASDHDMDSPLWWSQQSDFSSICTDDLSDVDTLSQLSAFYG
ncbi:unnamed protein product [Hyaloperonospora brassicae]|uniref:HSF-type DNA-binding domain-containing protein n=1 Tax=Hyaloperonospora brassicae TaxID=162125 RepID=A0AAV0T8C6_HYABA|nr:unnamed protein product [Hyaloperonospora brassicae]